MADLTALTDRQVIKAYDQQSSALATAMKGDPYHVTAKKSQENWEQFYEEVRRRGLMGQVCK